GVPRYMNHKVMHEVQRYVPSAMKAYGPNEEFWASELRRITVLFVSLGLDKEQNYRVQTNEDLNRLQDIIKTVQWASYQFEGSLNKFLMDDKGSTLIAVFGLRPLAHEDDAARGALSALTIIDKLSELGLKASVGVAT